MPRGNPEVEADWRDPAVGGASSFFRGTKACAECASSEPGEEATKASARATEVSTVVALSAAIVSSRLVF